MCLRPYLVIHRVTEIAPEWLKKNNIKGLLCDIDNTLTPYHSEEIPDDIVLWLESLRSQGIKFAPYSNARVYRINNFCSRFGIENPGMAIKPLNLGLTKTLRIMNMKKSELLLVGDQVFTDCLAGKFGGIRTVLVDPVSRKEFPATRVMRKVEKLVGRSFWRYDDISAF